MSQESTKWKNEKKKKTILNFIWISHSKTMNIGNKDHTELQPKEFPSSALLSATFSSWKQTPIQDENDQIQ